MIVKHKTKYQRNQELMKVHYELLLWTDLLGYKEKVYATGNQNSAGHQICDNEK